MIFKPVDIESIEHLQQYVRELLPLIIKSKIVLLKGDLGTGKTTLVKSVAELLKVTETVKSPTFSIINEYTGFFEGKSILIFHMDLYRLKDINELMDIGFEEYLDKNAVIFIEWPDLAFSLIEENALLIEIEMFDNSRRRLNLSNWSRSQNSHSDITSL